MNAVNLYRAQQLAISAAIDSGDYGKASDLLRQDLQTFAQSPTESAQTGHNQTLTAPQKCGIIKAIKRHVRRWKRKQEGKKMKKIKVWAFTANGIGWNGPVTMYFDSREHAEAARAKYDYSDPVQYAGAFSEDKFKQAHPRFLDENVNVGELYPTHNF